MCAVNSRSVDHRTYSNIILFDVCGVKPDSFGAGRDTDAPLIRLFFSFLILQLEY